MLSQDSDIKKGTPNTSRFWLLDVPRSETSDASTTASGVTPGRLDALTLVVTR